jgi:hypothetical protein
VKAPLVELLPLRDLLSPPELGQHDDTDPHARRLAAVGEYTPEPVLGGRSA